MMKSMRGLVLFGGMVLVLCCISTSAHALSDDEAVFRIYPPDWPQQFGPPVVYGEHGDGLEFSLSPDAEILPNTPRFNGVPPLDIDGTLFDSYDLSANSCGIVPSFDVTSYSMEGSIVATPEPATVLLLGLGAFFLRRKAV